MSNSQATAADAELILKLYDLRREPVMREARNFVAGLWPSLKTTDDLLAITDAFGTKENAYVRQVYSYWEMVASLIAHGTLNESLAFDTMPEMYFAYALIQPFIEEFRQKRETPDFMKNVQKLVESSAEGRQRVADLRRRMLAMAKRRAEAAKVA